MSIKVDLSQDDKKLKIEYLKNEIEQRGIYRVPEGFRSLPGKAPNTRYTWQFYLRRCMYDPKFVFTSAELLIDKLTNKDIQVGACEDAGVPLGLAISTILNSPMISIKKSRKSYGLLNFTEGRFIDKPILLVDDLAGSQNTLKSASRILSSFNLTLSDEYAVIINKTKGTHSENYIKDKKLISLFSCEDFAMTWKEYIQKFNKEPSFGSYY
jgi:orotate phosphoribosyltransferase